MDCAELWKTTGPRVEDRKMGPLTLILQPNVHVAFQDDSQDPAVSRLGWQKDEEAGSLEQNQSMLFFPFSPDLYSFLISLH